VNNKNSHIIQERIAEARCFITKRSMEEMCIGKSIVRNIPNLTSRYIRCV
jgi:hypothetical protein